MKKALSKPIGKRLIIGLLLLALAVTLGIVLADKFTGPESLMILRVIYVVCVIGLGLGSVAFVIFNWQGLLICVGFMFVLVLPRALPDPWNRYFAFLYMAALLGLPPLIAWLKDKKKPNKKTTGKKPNSLRQKLKILRMGLLIAIGVIALPWLFLDVPYKLFSALSLLPFPVTLTVICVFPDDISMDDKRSKKKEGKADFLTPLLFSGFAPGLRVLMDFNFLTWTPLLIQSGVLLVVIAVLLLVFYKELRQRIGHYLCILLLCAVFCLGSVGQLNYLLDAPTTRQQTATITDMHISSGSKSPDRYVLTVVTQTGTEMELKTSKEHYESLSVGESVTVYIKDGGLGIPYAMAD